MADVSRHPPMPDPAPPPDLLAHAAFVRRLAGHLLREGPDADDAAQETFVRALAHPTTRSGGRPWLAAVLRNVVRKGHRTEVRRGPREQAVARPERVQATDDRAMRDETLRAVTDAIGALDAASREVVLLRHYEDLPPREIAVRLGVPVETVKSRLKRAHERLRQALDERVRSDGREWRSALAALVGPVAAPVTPSAPLGGIPAMSVSSKWAVALAAGAVLVGGVLWFDAPGAESAAQPLAAPPSSAVLAAAPPPALAARGVPPPPAPVEPSNGPPVAGGMGGGAPPASDDAGPPRLFTAEEVRKGLVVLLQERLRLSILLATGIEAFVADKLPESLEAARAVLKEQPDNAKALELENAALLAQRGESSADVGAAQKRALGAWLTDLRGTVRLEELLLKWPSPHFWSRLAALRAAPKAAPAPSGEAYVRTLAAQATVTGTFENEPLSDVLRSLEAQTAVEILLDSALRASVPAPTVRSLDAHGLALSAALDAIAADVGVEWKVAGDVIRVLPRSVEGSPGRTGAPLVTRYYDVSDLLAPKKPFDSIDAILQKIRIEVEPSVWSDDARAHLEAVGQTLVVKASAEVHDGAKAWLARHR